MSTRNHSGGLMFANQIVEPSLHKKEVEVLIHTRLQPGDRGVSGGAENRLNGFQVLAWRSAPG